MQVLLGGRYADRQVRYSLYSPNTKSYTCDEWIEKDNKNNNKKQQQKSRWPNNLRCIIELTHRGPVTQYGGGSILCKTPIFFTMKEFPQI